MFVVGVVWVVGVGFVFGVLCFWGLVCVEFWGRWWWWLCSWVVGVVGGS